MVDPSKLHRNRLLIGVAILAPALFLLSRLMRSEPKMPVAGPGSPVASVDPLDGAPELEPRVGIDSVEPPALICPAPEPEGEPDLSDPFANFKTTEELYPLPWGDPTPPWPQHAEGALDEKYKDATVEELNEAFEETGLGGMGALVVELARLRKAGEYDQWPMHFELDENGEKVYQGMNMSLKAQSPFYTSRAGQNSDGVKMIHFIWADPASPRNEAAYLAFTENKFIRRRIKKLTGYAPQSNIAWHKLGTPEELFGGSNIDD